MQYLIQHLIYAKHLLQFQVLASGLVDVISPGHVTCCRLNC